MKNVETTIKTIGKAAAITGGVGLLCGASFILGRFRGWIDALVIAAEALELIKEEREDQAQNSYSYNRYARR